MTRAEILKELNDIFKDIFDDESIELSDETSAADIDGWDSLMNIHVLVAIEETFGTRITVEDAATLKSVGQIVDVITGKAD